MRRAPNSESLFRETQVASAQLQAASGFTIGVEVGTDVVAVRCAVPGAPLERAAEAALSTYGSLNPMAAAMTTRYARASRRTGSASLALHLPKKATEWLLDLSGPGQPDAAHSSAADELLPISRVPIALHGNLCDSAFDAVKI